MAVEALDQGAGGKTHRRIRVIFGVIESSKLRSVFKDYLC